MKALIKEHAVLVLGISLPLLLIALLLVMHAFARFGQEPPAHPVVFASFDHYTPQYWYEFTVDDRGRLQITYRQPDNPAYRGADRHGRLTVAVYDAAADRLETFDIDPPPDRTSEERIDIEPPAGLAALTLSGELTAPDGFRFESGYRRSGGLFGSIFGYGSNKGNRLVKDGIPYDVPELDSTIGTNQWIGWVIDET